MIEQVEELGPELRAARLLELERLENREIHVLEARIAEDIPAHGTEGSELGRNHHRSPVRGHVAAAGRQGGEVGRLCHALLRQCRGQVRRDAGNLRLPRATDAAETLRDVGDVAEVAVRNPTPAAGLEVAGVSIEIPAINEFSCPAEIITHVGYIPGLGSLKVHDGVEFPTLQ